VKLSKSTLKNLIKEELQNLDEVFGVEKDLGDLAAAAVSGVSGDEADNLDRRVAAGKDQLVKVLHDQVVSLKKEVAALRRAVDQITKGAAN